ncbi:hypothetical protein ACSMX9_22570 [Streptomyces sp. LE64]|uniref:hypothetical protein n=1 Tax=Streptomyces sp. LE64 TaxID=3448653 RepID=UPI0040411AE3
MIDEDLYEPVADPGADGGGEDLDAFFAEEATRRPGHCFTLYGREYRLPDSVPLLFTLQSERLRDSSDPADIRRMLAPLVGADALDTWAAAGMTDRQFGITLLYASANTAAAGSMTLPRAAELYDEQQARRSAEGEAPRPAPNRAARRATTNTKKKKAERGRSGTR